MINEHDIDAMKTESMREAELRDGSKGDFFQRQLDVLNNMYQYAGTVVDVTSYPIRKK